MHIHLHVQRSRWVAMLAGLVLVASAHATPSTPKKGARHHEDPDTLWRFVHDQCAPAARKGKYPPHPCAEVDAPDDPARGYVVFKDRAGRYQYLVLPLARITGIESRTLLAPHAPDYFADAWTARLYVEAALHKNLPRDELGLMVNSAHGRSQNQLHIHVDCIRPDVHAALRKLLPEIIGRWTTLREPLPPHHHVYRAKWVDGAALPINPFKSLAASLPSGDRMADHSLAVIGAYSRTGKPGFILLSTRVNRRTGNRGNSDDLQDLSCAIAK